MGVISNPVTVVGTPAYTTETVLAQFNTVFEFTTDANAIWTIDHFVAAGDTGANINNWTKLDFHEIGLTQDIGIHAVVGDWTGSADPDGLIVTADGFDFTIHLTGVMDPAKLTNDNIVYATNPIV